MLVVVAGSDEGKKAFRFLPIVLHFGSALFVREFAEFVFKKQNVARPWLVLACATNRKRSKMRLRIALSSGFRNPQTSSFCKKYSISCHSVAKMPLSKTSSCVPSPTMWFKKRARKSSASSRGILPMFKRLKMSIFSFSFSAVDALVNATSYQITWTESSRVVFKSQLRVVVVRLPIA